MRSRIVPCAVVAACSLAGASVFAQESAMDVARRDLISQAEQASSTNDHARAVELATRAAQIRVTPSIQYFLAREHQTLGHPVETLANAGGCARTAEADLTLRNREAILQACRALVTATEPRVGRIDVRVPSSAPRGLTVRVAQTELASALFGVPMPVAPGTVVIEASAEGFTPFRREVVVAAGQTASVDVTLVAVAHHQQTVVAPVSVEVAPIERPSRGPGVGPWIVAGAGVASFVLAGVFYGLAMSARSSRDAACAAGCLPIAQSYDSQYAGLLTGTTVTLVVGGAAVIGGATWFLLGRRSASSAARSALHLNVAPTSGGVAFGVGGRF